MGDSRRFGEVADFTLRNFPPDKYPHVGDVAGGQGFLHAELQKRGYQVTTIDPNLSRKKFKGLTYRRAWYTTETKLVVDLLIGLHPDGASEVILYHAKKQNIPFIILPCCVIPTLTNFEGTAYEWRQHLKRYNSDTHEVYQTLLPFHGEKWVIYGKPIFPKNTV